MQMPSRKGKNRPCILGFMSSNEGKQAIPVEELAYSLVAKRRFEPEYKEYQR
jgi:hypothetical protein